MGTSKTIGAIAFGPNASDSTKEDRKAGPFSLDDAGTKRLVTVLAGAGKVPDLGADASSAHQATQARAVYHLIGEDMQPVARNIKGFAFAYALALRWSRDLEQPIKLVPRMDIDGADESQPTRVVDASTLDSGAYLNRRVHAEIARIHSAAISLREIADDVQCMIEDADKAISALRTLAETGAVPSDVAAQAAHLAADHFDTLNWYTLITDADTEMQGELLSVSGENAA